MRKTHSAKNMIVWEIIIYLLTFIAETLKSEVMKMRLIDADELLTKAQDYGEGQEKLILIDPYYVKKAKTVQAIPISDNATNGDMIKAIFPNVEVKERNNGYEVYFGIGTASQYFNYQWWNALYKRGSEND